MIIITYSEQAFEALQMIEGFDRRAYHIALTLMQDKLAAFTEPGVVDTVVKFSVGNDSYTISFAALVDGVTADVTELGWEIA
ncbi:hypothetical protein [Streptomyces niveus]|uniref:hypothetical protein n=1 Tax=Streptomyces niveus TaxID=193462 RepID=UPI0034449A56